MGSQRNIVLTVSPHNEQTSKVVKALAHEPRQAILELLCGNLLNVSEIAKRLDMPVSTANVHVQILEDAGLILAEHKPASRGSQKVCTASYNSILLQFPQQPQTEYAVAEVSMPIGNFSDCNIIPTCGLASAESVIGLLDDPTSFYEPNKHSAQLIWFHQGHLEYRFPNRVPAVSTLHELHLSLELCSEAPRHHEHWPSDITLWINEIEIGTWTCAADFGDQRGKLTPSWWDSYNTQYGLLKLWKVNHEGTFIDGIKLSNIRLEDLNIHQERFIPLRIGIKEDALHIGGVNIFGRSFGNYPEDITLSLLYL